MKAIDNFLNRITMYRLVLYLLTAWIALATALGAFGKLPFAPQALLFSTAVLTFVSWITNRLFAKVYGVQTNIESVYITAFILALIISPPAAGQYLASIPLLIWAAIWAMASKFILAINKKHIFNPAAFAVALAALTINQSASWWIGTLYMLPFVLLGGALIVRKIRRFDLVVSFFVAALITIFANSLGTGGWTAELGRIFIDSPIIFFATVMLTEPLTTPPTRTWRIIYGAIVGLLFAPGIHIGSIYSTPELALIAGNIFSWLMSPKFKLMLTLKSKEKIASNTGEFVFATDRAVAFRPGQYLEWTLEHDKPDSRGNRRYFTIASSPTENELRLGIRFEAEKSSSFKKALAELPEGGTIMAGQLSGDFTMPRDKKKKLCFIAGGIGVTPFRSMIGYMLDKNEMRDIVLIYSVKNIRELSYTDFFRKAHDRLGLKTVATLTDIDRIAEGWTGHRGFVDAAMIAAEVPDFLDRTFFISGPRTLVDACTSMLKSMGVPRKRIKTDYFPGFA